MFKFYVQLLRSVPAVFRHWWEASAFWASVGIIVLAAVVPVAVSRLQLAGWYALIPSGVLLIWAALRANYDRCQVLERQVGQTKDRKARQRVVDELAQFRAEACNLLAKTVRGEGAYVLWQIEVNRWAEKVGPYLEKHFSPAVRSKFDFVGLHEIARVVGAYNDAHNQGIRILDRKVKVLESIIGDGLAQPVS